MYSVPCEDNILMLLSWKKQFPGFKIQRHTYCVYMNSSILAMNRNIKFQYPDVNILDKAVSRL